MVLPAGCADSIDIGENSYAMVLADDLDNNGLMELVAATMNGNVYAFQTAAEYHPLKSWTSTVSDLGACHPCHSAEQCSFAQGVSGHIRTPRSTWPCLVPSRALQVAVLAEPAMASSGSISSWALLR